MPAERSSSHAAFATYVWGWVLGVYGVALIVGGWDRFPQSYIALAELPGAPYWFGGLWCVAAAAGLIGQRWDRILLRNSGLEALMVLCLATFGMVSFAVFAFPDQPGGIEVIWFGIAIHLYVLQRLQPRRVAP